MATYAATVADPVVLEAERDPRGATIAAANSTTSTPRVSIERDGITRRSVR